MCDPKPDHHEVCKLHKDSQNAILLGHAERSRPCRINCEWVQILTRPRPRPDTWANRDLWLSSAGAWNKLIASSRSEEDNETATRGKRVGDCGNAEVT